MKLNGQVVKAPKPELVVIPREGVDLVFKAQTVLNFDDFDKLCPVPLPPTIIKPGGEQFQDVNDKNYREKFNAWAGQKADWMFLKSLEATDDLEWETVNMSKAETWGNYKKELKDSKFSEMEIVALIQAVSNACGLSEDKLIEARKRFLAIQEAQQKELSSQKEEQ